MGFVLRISFLIEIIRGKVVHQVLVAVFDVLGQSVTERLPHHGAEPSPERPAKKAESSNAWIVKGDLVLIAQDRFKRAHDVCIVTRQDPGERRQVGVCREIGFAPDSLLEEAVSSEPVSVAPNIPCLAGNLQGISSSPGSSVRQRQQKRALTQCVTGEFPTHPNRELFAALQGIKSGDQGIKSGDQGIFRPDQGRGLWLAFCRGVKVPRLAALLPPWGLIGQSGSPERLGHRVATGGSGIPRAHTRLAGSKTFLRPRCADFRACCGRPRFRGLIEPHCQRDPTALRGDRKSVV